MQRIDGEFVVLDCFPTLKELGAASVAAVVR
jgi:hypothetical protein